MIFSFFNLYPPSFLIYTELFFFRKIYSRPAVARHKCLYLYNWTCPRGFTLNCILGSNYFTVLSFNFLIKIIVIETISLMGCKD